MTWGDEVRGVVGAGSRDPGRTFGQTDADLLEAFANLVSLALRNAESYEQSARQARIQRGFYRIASVLAEPLSLQETFDALAQAAGEALGAERRRGARRRCAGAARAGRGPRAVAGARATRSRRAWTTRAARCSAPPRRAAIVTAGALEGDERFDDDVAARRRSRAATGRCSRSRSRRRRPTRRDSSSRSSSEERRFSDDDLELARHLAGAARGALERSELFEAERTSRALAQQLARTGSLLATELDPEAVLDEVVAQAPALLGADACSIRLVEGDELVVQRGERRGRGGEPRQPRADRRCCSPATSSSRACRSPSPTSPPSAASPRPTRCSPATSRTSASRSSGPRAASTACSRSTTGPSAPGARRRSRRSARSPRTRRRRSPTPSCTSASRSRRSAASRSSRTSPTGSSPSTATGSSCSGTRPPSGSPACPTEEALGQTPEQVLRRELRSDGDAPAGDRLLAIRRGDEEVWLSLTEAVMRDPAGQVAGRIFAFRDISAERIVDDMKSTLRVHGLARAAHAADLDLRLRGDAAARGRALRRRAARARSCATSRPSRSG